MPPPMQALLRLLQPPQVSLVYYCYTLSPSIHSYLHRCSRTIYHPHTSAGHSCLRDSHRIFCILHISPFQHAHLHPHNDATTLARLLEYLLTLNSSGLFSTFELGVWSVQAHSTTPKITRISTHRVICVEDAGYVNLLPLDLLNPIPTPHSSISLPSSQEV